ncbi:MAG TPA: Do family serine endopeptidase [Draconibacterium sp.]|nr:Do family serine endopeptidase [Draconibacterium sp.]
MKKITKFITTFVIALAAATLVVLIYTKFDVPKQKILIKENTPVQLARQVNGPSQQGQLPDLTWAAEKSVHAVVHIQVKMEEQMDNSEMNPFYYFFFGPGQPGHNNPRGRQQPQYEMASGSGVIISPDGYIVTNNHVVDDAVNVQVILDDNRKFTAKVIGKDANTDIALVKIDADNLPYLTWGDSDALKLGQWVLAVGNPFNLTSTVTAGIVSAKSRSIGINQGPLPLESFIQTDAAVNPGNSGGALVNTNGELVGINSAIASQTGSYSGYSFAVPATIASKVVDDLKKYGEVQRAVLGVMMQTVNDSIGKANHLDKMEGAFVVSTTDDGAARDAGIKKGDIIVSIDGNSVNTSSQLQEQIGKYSPGDKITVGLLRDGKEKDIDVVLRNMKGDTSIVKEPTSALGAEFGPVSEKDMAKLKIDEGVQVVKLSKGKLKEAGVKEGFIITEINKIPVSSKEDVDRVYMRSDDKKPILVEGFYPDKGYAYYVIKPEA